jgi:hypothetical protein
LAGTYNPVLGGLRQENFKFQANLLRYNHVSKNKTKQQQRKLSQIKTMYNKYLIERLPFRGSWHMSQAFVHIFSLVTEERG